MAALLTVKNLQAWYGESHVLHGVNLHVDEGEMICILGRNGMETAMVPASGRDARTRRSSSARAAAAKTGSGVVRLMRRVP